MKSKNILILIFGLTLNLVHSQNKKEQIEALNFSLDSLNTVVQRERTFSSEKIKEIEILKKQIVTLNESDNTNKKEIQKLVRDNELIAEQNDKINLEIARLKLELENAKKNDLSKWLKNNLNIIIDKDSLVNHGLNLTAYTTELSNEFKVEIGEDYWLGLYSLNNIKIKKNGIVCSLSTDDYSKFLILTEKFIIISYHVSFGTDGQTIIYNLSNKSYYVGDNFMAYGLISSNILEVEKDYFDRRDVDDPNYEGHIVEYGSYNLLTEEYKFISKD